MSFQYTLVTLLMYTELFVISFFLIPVISTQKWKEIFGWPFIRFVIDMMDVTYLICAFLLSILFIGSLRDMLNFEVNTSELEKLIQLDMEFQLKRNVYVIGLTLFLWFLLNRLVDLIRFSADLQYELETVGKTNIELQGALNAMITTQTYAATMVFGLDSNDPEKQVPVKDVEKERKQHKKTSENEKEKEKEKEEGERVKEKGQEDEKDKTNEREQSATESKPYKENESEKTPWDTSKSTKTDESLRRSSASRAQPVEE